MIELFMNLKRSITIVTSKKNEKTEVKLQIAPVIGSLA